MSKEINPQREDTKSDSSPNSSATPPANVPLDPDADRAIRIALRRVLKEIPYFGQYILIVESNWGCTGVLFMFVGFMIAAVLVFTGIYPPFAVGERLKTEVAISPTPTPSPPPAPDYELKLAKDLKLEVENAKNRVWASGVALSKLDPRILTERLKAGVSVQVVYLDPCGEAIKKRQTDENNPSATNNVRTRLTGYDTFSKLYNLAESEKSSLQVRVLDVYPTMAVIIIDNDLYAYFCRFGDVCSASPALVFKDYTNKKPKDPAAEFFENHFNASFAKARRVTNFTEPCSP
jgi:hypothetical protein